MRKKDLVKKLVEDVRGSVVVNESQTAAIVDALFKTISECIVTEGQFQFIGFGTFKVRDCAARSGRNPRTGQPLQIPKSKRISFQPAQTLKAAANEACVVDDEEEEEVVVECVKVEKAVKAPRKPCKKAKKS